MKKLTFALLIAVLALTAATIGDVQAAGPAGPTGNGQAQAATTPTGGNSGVPQTLTVTLTQQNGSGENGTATITAAGDNAVRVMVQLSNGPTTPQPAHIHKGTCANLDPVPAYPLSNVVNGMSDTTVSAAMADLAKGGYAINVHKSAQEIATYVSCGDIMATNTNPGTPGQPGSPPGGVPLPTQSITVQMNAQNGSGENGTATITVAGQDQVTVVLNLTNGPSTPQPAHIHKGTCANLNPVPAYPLTNVVNGQSQTTVNAGLGDLMTQGYAINVHKSAAEVSTYVSCGDITAMTMPGGTTGGSTGGQTGGGTPGMPTTGNGDQTNLLLALTLLALLTMGAGLTLVRRRA